MLKVKRISIFILCTFMVMALFAPTAAMAEDEPPPFTITITSPDILYGGTMVDLKSEFKSNIGVAPYRGHYLFMCLVPHGSTETPNRTNIIMDPRMITQNPAVFQKTWKVPWLNAQEYDLVAYVSRSNVNIKNSIVGKSIKVVRGSRGNAMPVESIKMNCASKTINAGKTFTLKASVSPETSTSKAVEWTSSNPKVAAVDANGRVSALKAGNAKITATATDGSGVNASCAVTVNQPVTKVKITTPASELKMLAGTKKQLTATVSPTSSTNKTLYWYSSDPNILQIDKSTGYVKALKVGSVRICAKTADGSGCYANARVTVY